MQRNITLDYFKIFLSILVIAIHIPYPYQTEGALNWWWYIPNGIARIAVPFFFIINGYFFAKKIDDTKAIKKYLIHLLIIYTTWFIIYLRPFIYQTEQSSIFSDFRIDILLEAYVMGYFHIWYLPALIGGIILLVLLKKMIRHDVVILIIALLLYITGYILEPGKESLYFVRNGLFFGFPFIAIGYYIHKIDIKNIKNQYIILIASVMLILLLVEAFISYKTLHTRDLYLSLLILCPSLFLLTTKYSILKESNKYSLYLGSLSSAIYFSHVYVIFKSFTIFEVTPITRFFVVLLITIPVSIFIIFVNKRIKIFL